MTLERPELWRLDYYNLICYSNPDNDVFHRSEGREKIEKSRLWEYTDDETIEAFKENTVQLAQLPSLVLTECNCRSANNCTGKAFFTRLSSIHEERNSIAFGFHHLGGGMTSCEAFNYLTGITLGPGERTRTHWAVKKGNLLERMGEFWAKQTQRGKPSVFGIEDWPLPQQGHIAVMMPFSAAFQPVFDAISGACARERVPSLRVDDIYGPNVIIKDIFSTIETSRLVICDITNKNPNVLYEAGIAHARNKDVILLTQNDADVPFNLSQIRHIRYLPNQEGFKKLEDDVHKFIIAAFG